MSQNDLELYDELSRINNELVTTQRQLAQNNRELEKLASENARLYAEAQEALRVQNAFLSMLTHDLKTPLSTIIGYAQLLAKRLAREPATSSAKLLPGLKHIETTAEKMIGQVSSLLELARLRSGEAPELELQPVDLVSLVRGVTAELRLAFPGRTIVVKTTVESLIGQWDIGQLERLLHNLLSNAIKYSPNGGDVTVELETDRVVDDPMALAVIRVRDHGLGIPAADLPHIFEPFHRAGNILERVDGTGLGLFSVRQIVEQHNGSISVESEEGVGTTFIARLPRCS